MRELLTALHLRRVDGGGASIPAPSASLVSALVDGAIGLDAHGVVESVNDAFCTLTGFDRGEVLGQAAPYPWTWPVQLDGPDALIASATGDPLAVIVSETVLRDEQRRITARVLSFRDVTERAIAERALREAEERFRSVFDAAPIGMAILSLRGTFVRANRRLGDMLGYDPEELGGMPVSGVTHPDDRDAHRAALAALADGEPLHRGVTRFIAPGGRLVWAELTASLVRDADGAPLHVVAQLRDVTLERATRAAREAAETGLRASERRFRTLSEHVPVAIYETDTSGSCLWCNDAWSRLTGVSSTGGLHAPVATTVHPEDRAYLESRWATALTSGEDFTAAYRYVRPDGDVVPVVARVTAIHDDDGRVTGFLGTDTPTEVDLRRLRAA
jgi:PAS domain S-box-containing protein